ncbi:MULTISPECIES: acetyl-coenzyme A carboxylase carboxyl transferase subunits beta/alpha [Rhodococcus]|uniref:Carboxyl transferase domain-containing protein n=1 Tax=Rhodococcus oxybenzonivorans TaxID=1990687 RepID=A0AAE4V049_9NOCA|nr:MULTISPECIES: carboxyl transferase domain-containing protein [Rhodococcus]MDV7240736.1 carboxyl transferase domain-containing protein [Rhodococcus oxybenzonivorans]MDV7265812.1 carboxyl transferase domain-containing protein [Rhodococcus oxybenzonivorans]MDV7273009.1 carboxyl transferase domain-containing protein [Rhodococcus oxybenzonivorans]MDV7333253.1 carboxyl transferase domain-containing protein [Rhodococcus oxybenzonivorans]MDV7342419.1 carboxyl transferase domain-containing protein [
MAAKISAHDVLELVLDQGSYVSWDTTPVDVRPDDKYGTDLMKATEKSGVDESVLTGVGTVRGRRVAVIACEFAFLAGSIGVAAAERIVSAIERATREGLPLLASPTSGGTRMQEGTVAFVQMVKIAAAVATHKAAHLPYLVYLRNPTTGGVFASWGSLGHITVAEPGALVGFLGPRVYAALYGEKFPDGVQTSENLYRNGVIDGVVPASRLRLLVHRALRVLIDPPATPTVTVEVPDVEIPDVPAWQSVMLSRRADRPGIRHLLRHAATEQVPLSGTGQGETEGTVLLSLARFRGAPCVLLGQDRAGQSALNTMGPAALREARRGMRLAEELQIPLVLVIDTLGAALSKEAEERGLAPEIARCISDLVTLKTPTVSVLLGQGTGGGALAFLPADRVLAAQNGWLAPLPPEGASAIVHRDTTHAPEMAAAQGIRSLDLLRDGVIDSIIPERPDAADEPVDFSKRVGEAISRELRTLTAAPDAERFAARLARYRNLGLPNG